MGNVIKLHKDDETALQLLMSTPSIVEDICKWNAARYDQQPSHELTMTLLLEELQETEEAYKDGEVIAILDGLGDIFYVAIGALWKTGLHHDQIARLLDAVEEKMPLIPSPAVALHWYQEDVQNPLLALVALSCLKRLSALLSSDDLALDVIRAICISNNTKTATKTDNDVKANIDKGSAYVPPTEMLEDILQKVDFGGNND